MGTRSEIIIKDYWTNKQTGGVTTKKVKLYHHYDGYPEGVGKFLMREIYPKLISSNSMDIDVIANKLLKSEEDNTFELTVYNHVDIEYLYEIDIPKKEIKCWSAHYTSWDSPTTRCIKGEEQDLSVYAPQSMKLSYC